MRLFAAFLLLSLFGDLTVSAQTTLFGQSFSTDENEATLTGAGTSTYTSASPTTGQFTSVQRSSTTTVSVTGGKLVFDRTGNSGSGRFVRSASLAASPPGSLYIQLRLRVTCSDAQASAMVFYLGGDPAQYTDNGVIPANAGTYAKIGVDFLTPATPAYQLVNAAAGGANGSSALPSGDTHVVSWLLNNTGAAIPYAVPDASGNPSATTAMLADDKFQVYVDGTKQFASDVSVLTGSQTMNYFKMLFSNGTGTISFDDITIRDIAGALPVELTYFRAQPTEEGSIRLEWATASEQNSSHFVVERSADLREFTEIARRDAAGTSRLPRQYSSTDTQPLPGTSYYRLRQVDTDGGEHLYRPVSVAIWTGETAARLFPNPTATGQPTALWLTAADQANVTVVNVTGQTVTCQFLTDSPTFGQLRPDSPLPPGVYLVRVQTPEHFQTLRWVVR